MTRYTTGRARRIGPQSVPLAFMLESWIRALEGENKSPFTIRSYADSVRRLIRDGDPGTDITTAQLREHFAALHQVLAPASVAVHYRSLRVFFGWLAEEEPALMPVSPMKGVGKIVVPRSHKAPFSEADLRALLAACGGDSFEDRRDYAILRVLFDTGVRISGLAGIRYPQDVSLGQRTLLVRLKGGDRTAIPVGKKAVAAIDRYLRARIRHPRAAETEWLWLGTKRPRRDESPQFTTWGIRQMLTRRGRQAGVGDVHPHRFRRTFTHDWLTAGGGEHDLMKITGWSTPAMIEVYAGELAGERARAAHARLSPGDRI